MASEVAHAAALSDPNFLLEVKYHVAAHLVVHAFLRTLRVPHAVRGCAGACQLQHHRGSWHTLEPKEPPVSCFLPCLCHSWRWGLPFHSFMRRNLEKAWFWEAIMRISPKGGDWLFRNSVCWCHCAVYRFRVVNNRRDTPQPHAQAERDHS